jgi:hypothetical protein
MATRQIAQGIAQLGRNGDSTLVHMQPHEVAGLQALAKSQGTSLTVNPDTGLPEAFSLGGFFKSLLPTIAGFAASGMTGGALSPMMAGILAGAGTGALTSKDPLTGALMGGLGGYGGSQLFTAANAFTPAAKTVGAGATGTAATPQAVQQAVSQAGGVMDPYMQQQISMFTPAGGSAQTAALGGNQATYGSMLDNTAATAYGNYAPNFNAIPGAAQGAGGYQAPSMFTSDASKLTNAMGNVSADPLGFISQNKMGVGMPLAGAALGGLEPSDLYGNPIPRSNKDKYDPYATLNLGGDSGLRLYANGGPVSFADGGDANKELSLDPVGLPGGGLGAMEGAGQYEVTPGGTKLGLFATAEQIEAARQADALAKASQGRGLGSLQDILGPLKSTNIGMYGSVPMPSKLLTAMTAPTAKTASTGYDKLAALNLNKQYAEGGLTSLYEPQDNSPAPTLSQDGYGLGRLQAMTKGGMPSYAKGGYLDGPGDGMSDSIPATIEGKQPARLADGEFVIPADVVSHLGNGSTKAGSQRLYGMLDKVRKARTGTKKQGKQINPNKFMPA